MTDKAEGAAGSGPEKKEPVVPVFVQINGSVRERLKTSGEELKSRIVTKLFEEEMTKRQAMVETALKKLSEGRKEIEKLNRETVVTYSLSGEKIETRSAANVQAIKKAGEVQDRLEKVLEKAINEADFGPLQKAISGGGGNKNDNKSDGESSDAE